MNQDTTSERRWPGAKTAMALIGGASLLFAGIAGAQGQMRGDDYSDSGMDRLEAEPEHGLIGGAIDYVKHNSYFRVGVLHFQYYGDSSRLKVENAQGLAAQAFGEDSSRLDHTGSSAGDKTTLGGTIGLFGGERHSVDTCVRRSQCALQDVVGQRCTGCCPGVAVDRVGGSTCVLAVVDLVADYVGPVYKAVVG